MESKQKKKDNSLTALHRAIIVNNGPCLRQMLIYGADTTLGGMYRGKAFANAQELAELHGSDEMKDILKRNGQGTQHSKYLSVL